MNVLSKAYWIAKGVGWDNVPRRVWQSFMVRSRLLERRLDPSRFRSHNESLTSREYQKKQWRERRSRFFRPPGREQLNQLVDDQTWDASVTRICREALEGKYPLFSHSQGELGWPPDFNLDPVNNIRWPVHEHWLRTARSGPPRNDIKLVWEASRLTLAFYLARQYVRSGEGQWAEAFWELVDAWTEQNPVNESVAWGCGQETAFRLFAMLFGAFATLESEAATEERLAKLELLCWQFAKRIEANINYAISQENNHGLSEAVGLWTVGLLFPELDASPGWVKKAHAVLDAETRRQIYSDGSYVQNSMSYHRVMLDDMCWAIALGRQCGQPLSKGIVERVGKAVDWLAEFVDAREGRVPNYGANDGANVLPLSCSDYLDYRPILQAAAHLCACKTGQLGVGAWSEKTLWLTGCLPENKPGKSTFNPAWQAPIGGYHILRGPQSQAILRATSYRDRPGHCDMLHLDLWYRGYNILRDAGSYRYYHESPDVKSYFYSVAAHNTVQVGDSDQMTKGPNFLWFHWPRGSAVLVDENTLRCQAEFSGDTPYRHHRSLVRFGDRYTVEDRVEGGSYALRWRLAPEFRWRDGSSGHYTTTIDGQPFSVQVKADPRATMSLTEASESLYYGQSQRTPAVLVSNLIGPVTTIIGPTLE